jgi:hypothetical protein
MSIRATKDGFVRKELDSTNGIQNTFFSSRSQKVKVKLNREETEKDLVRLVSIPAAGNVVVARLDSGSTYHLQVHNDYQDLRCDVTLDIDGEFKGIFRMRPGESIAIRHPYNDQHKFKIVSAASGGSSSNFDGLIKLTFEPEWADKNCLMKGAAFRALDDAQYEGKVKQTKIELGYRKLVPDKVVASRGIGQAKTIQGDLSKQNLEDVEEGLLYDTNKREVIAIPTVISTLKREAEHQAAESPAKKSK